MKYESEDEVVLGDLVRFDVGSDKYVTGRIVMLGGDYTHLKISPEFIDWATIDKVLEKKDVVVDVDSGADSYMVTTPCCVQLIQRAEI